MAVDVVVGAVAVAGSVSAVLWVAGRVVERVLESVGSLVRRVEVGDGVGVVVDGADLFGGSPVGGSVDWSERWLPRLDGVSEQPGYEVPDLAGEELEL